MSGYQSEQEDENEYREENEGKGEEGAESDGERVRGLGKSRRNASEIPEGR
jgi:hypothetical protein